VLLEVLCAALLAPNGKGTSPAVRWHSVPLRLGAAWLRDAASIHRCNTLDSDCTNITGPENSWIAPVMRACGNFYAQAALAQLAALGLLHGSAAAAASIAPSLSALAAFAPLTVTGSHIHELPTLEVRPCIERPRHTCTVRVSQVSQARIWAPDDPGLSRALELRNEGAALFAPRISLLPDLPSDHVGDQGSFTIQSPRA